MIGRGGRRGPGQRKVAVAMLLGKSFKLICVSLAKHDWETNVLSN